VKGVTADEMRAHIRVKEPDTNGLALVDWLLAQVAG
jgi:hypothetical protein